METDDRTLEKLGSQTSLASSRISVLLAKSFEIGQPALASAAALAKTSCVAPGTLAVVVSAIFVIAKPPSTLPSETAAWVSILFGVRPAPPNCAPRAMEKHPAWAAAISSSGGVPLAAPPNRACLACHCASLGLIGFWDCVAGCAATK